MPAHCTRVHCFFIDEGIRGFIKNSVGPEIGQSTKKTSAGALSPNELYVGDERTQVGILAPAQLGINLPGRA